MVILPIEIINTTATWEYTKIYSVFIYIFLTKLRKVDKRRTKTRQPCNRVRNATIHDYIISIIFIYRFIFFNLKILFCFIRKLKHLSKNVRNNIFQIF